MSNPFIGEIRMFGGSFAPYGWAMCNGQVVPISQNEALYQLIGTTYGGNGQTTFQLPNLQGRVPIHQGQGTGLQNYPIGSIGGSETVSLLTSQLPSHNHQALASPATTASQSTPAGNAWSGNQYKQFAAGTSANAQMNAGSVGNAGGGTPHENMLPFLAITFIISMVGIFPSPN
jgi:microcystin-dependent protein